MCKCSIRLLLFQVFVFLLVVPYSACFAEDDASLWSEASAKVDAGDLTGGASLLTRLITDFPSSPKAPGAQLKLAYIKVKTGPDATQELLDAFSLVRARYASSPEAGTALARIGFLHSRNNTAQAIADFTAFLKDYPVHPHAPNVQRTLGSLYLRSLDLDKAEAAFDAVKEIPNAPLAVVEEANMQSGFVKMMRFYKSRDKANLLSAMESFGGLSSAADAKVRAKSELGTAEALLLFGKAADAHEKYKAAAQTYSDQPYFKGLALYGAGVSSQEIQKPDQAASEFSAFLDSQAGSTLADKDAAWKRTALSSLGSYIQITVQKDGSLEKIPASGIVPKAAYLWGECLYTAGKYKEAEKQLSAVVAAFPGTESAESAKNAIARCRMATGGEQ